MSLIENNLVTEVAVKVFDCRKKKNFKIFHRELRVYCQCQDQFLLTFYGASLAGDFAMIVLELGDGGSFWDQLKQCQKDWKNKLIPVEWIKHLEGVAQAMNVVSEAGVMHRDLTINNLLLVNKNCKLTDFGVSAIEQDKCQIVRGSVRHYAPESMQGKEKYQIKSDVFSFGNLIFELIHGKKIWGKLSVAEVVDETMKGNREIIRVPCYQRLRSLVYNCWKQNANERPTFREIRDELEQIVNEIIEDEKGSNILSKKAIEEYISNEQQIGLQKKEQNLKNIENMKENKKLE